MPKATIKYDLNDPDDKMDFERLMQLGNLSSFVFQLTHNTKKQIIREVENSNFDNVETAELIFSKIHDLIDEYSVDLEKL